MLNNCTEKNEDKHKEDNANSQGEQTPLGSKPPEESKEPSLEEKILAHEKRIVELEQENVQLKDLYLRKVAEFDNFRKRMIKEKQEATQFANRQLLLDLIHILDDFERAIQSANESKQYDSFHEGIMMIERRLIDLLERKWGLKRNESLNQPFDPNKHEAIASEERSEHETPLVLEDYQKGYSLHDRVIRTAKVKVSIPKGKESSNPIHDEQNTMAGS